MSERLFFRVSGCDATGYQTPNGLTVMAGSKGHAHLHRSAPASVECQRDALRAQGVIVIQGEELLFLKDYAFASPSAAGKLLAGIMVNGPHSWRNANGQSLNELAGKLRLAKPKGERVRKTAGARKVMNSLAISINSFCSILDDTDPTEVDLDKHRDDIQEIFAGMAKIGNFLKKVKG